ncbi:hypothetical protein [Prosthecobacter sp.]|uniref:hypothetical protein n=1 Tax=Prosthecobacter sp. TaxID=1965333 RepID=UPI001D51F851|nr:hypothetical protein [Prosthecobacter sp.]MCB1278815.1 hypothetical protein [Prosthecobacter sp.]
MKSTKCTDAKMAQKIDDEFHNFAFTASPDHGTVSLTRRHLPEVVTNILRIACHRL